MVEFNSKEYITVRFNREDEEHLIPKNILAKSKKIRKLLEENDGNHLLQIDSVAAEAFFMLVHYINGLKSERTEEEIHKMIEAAQHLELNDATLNLQKLAKKYFDPPPAAPPA